MHRILTRPPLTTTLVKDISKMQVSWRGPSDNHMQLSACMNALKRVLKCEANERSQQSISQCSRHNFLVSLLSKTYLNESILLQNSPFLHVTLVLPNIPSTPLPKHKNQELPQQVTLLQLSYMPSRQQQTPTLVSNGERCSNLVGSLTTKLLHLHKRDIYLSHTQERSTQFRARKC